MLRTLAAITMLAATLLVASSAASKDHRRHRPGCNRSICDWWADRAYARHNRPKFRITAFELCVAREESGVNWQYDDGTYEGAYNWLNSTWISMGGGRYASRAIYASPREQTLIFRAHWSEPGQWPKTVPACGG